MVPHIPLIGKFMEWVGASTALNSIIIAGTVTIICLIFGTLAAYALARLEFPFKNNIVRSLVSIRMIPTVCFKGF
jgi:ABC-type glycerol-3-phosphate transport system permease component